MSSSNSSSNRPSSRREAILLLGNSDGTSDHSGTYGQRNTQKAVHMRHRSIISSSSSSSSLSSLDGAVYEAEVYLDSNEVDHVRYQSSNVVDIDETSKLYAATSNGSIHPPDDDHHHRHTTDMPYTDVNRDIMSRAAYNNSNRDIPVGSPSSATYLRGIDYSEYTYDLGWTAASRIHSRNSTLPSQQQTTSLANVSPGMFGTPGFNSPSFLAAHAASRGLDSEDADDLISALERHQREQEFLDQGDIGENDDDDNEYLEDEENDDFHTEQTVSRSVAVEYYADREAVGVASNKNAKIRHATVSATSPPLSSSPQSLAGYSISESISDMPYLIDYASPRVPPFPSTSEAEELLYSRMSPKSRAALAKLMHGRGSRRGGSRPPRFRPPISQNMGYGAIQRHPFYYAPSSSSRSISESLVTAPDARQQPVYQNLRLRNNGQFEDDGNTFMSKYIFYLGDLYSRSSDKAFKESLHTEAFCTVLKFV
ncbi:hypothetical protein V1511DRAFT_499856 [Dipodascopsis uninucleata]